jgi:hypothetical protein
LHPIALVLAPSIPLIAVGVWWNSNSISHHFLHLPFFQSKTANRVYALYLSALLGIPQSIWRDRHLAHHRGDPAHVQWRSLAAADTILVLVIWGVLALMAPRFFLMVYLPGIILGLTLCYLHGYFEHVGGGTTSNYGLLYNLAFFNDGYHVEHHVRPSQHWTQMRELLVNDGKVSRWPAILRWMDFFSLETPERIALRSRWIQSFLLRTHGRALERLLAELPPVQTVTIVGGGMYPRTALLLRRLLPNASIRILDSEPTHLDIARKFLSDGFLLECAHFAPESVDSPDLVVIPLSFTGDREAIYRTPPAPAVLVHDWIWRKRGRSAIVSLFLLKRVNLITR